MTAVAWCRIGVRAVSPCRVMFGLLAALAVSGCHSATVDTTIENQSNAPLRLVEVDYPSASFGTGVLAPHAQFHYRFKIQGSGAIKLQYVDATDKPRNVTGPELVEGQQGSLTVTINPAGAVIWKPLLATKR